MGDEVSRPPAFDRDILTTSAEIGAPQEDLREIITLIARASHEIADLVSLGQVADARDETSALTARRVLLEQLRQGRVRTLSCVDDAQTLSLNADGRYSIAIDPLEGLGDHDANLPFGTIFSISDASEGKASGEPPGGFYAAGFIHYGPQTNLVFSLGAGVHIFNLDRSTRTYRLAAQDIKIPDEKREWSIDVTKRRRWPSSIRALIDEELEHADADADGARASVRWTGSLTADAYRILRQGGVYLCPMDDQAGRETACPDLIHAARPVAFVIEQAGGRATTGSQRIMERASENATDRTSMIFGSPGVVERIERLHALPENRFDSSPLFHQRGLFWT